MTVRAIAVHAAIIAACLLAPAGNARAQAPSADILSRHVLAKQENRYIGWPSIARTPDGRLIAVFSGDRDQHVCPWGKTQMVTSDDDGVTWSGPVTVNNTPLDDRDAGIIVTRTGTLVVSWFTSLAFMDPRYADYISRLPKEETASWTRHIEKLSQRTRDEWLGCWVRRSEDGGESWGDFIRTSGNAPHGPIQLADGRLLYAGKTLWSEPRQLSVEESWDDGRTWRRIGTIPVAPGESIDHCHELHAAELPDGRIVALIRYNPPDRDNQIMRMSMSDDGGRSWSTPRPTGIWGYPPHLIVHSSGALVCVYGHRREPFGERAVVSMDGGETWDTEHAIELAPAPNGDLGYPASVELPDGSIYTVFYQQEREGEKTCLMGVRWRLK